MAESEIPRTRNEFAKLSQSGIRSTYEQVEDLIALGILKEIENKRIKVTLDPEFPFYDSLRDILMITKDYPGTSQDVLKMLDRICGDNYYLGAYTAARQRITPVDYDPPVYVINTLKKHHHRLYPRIKALGKLSNIKVNENREKTGDITIVVHTCDSIPYDVKKIPFLSIDLWITSVERGIIECLIKKTPFTLYGTYLALLQNRIDNSIDLAYLKEIAEKEKCISTILAIISKFNEVSGKNIFEITPEEKMKASLEMVDEKEIRNVINTVMG